MYEYSRDVYYYETDKMGVVHHSNYLRWLEEARTFFFNDADLAYVETESYGVMSPITDISVKYKFPARFGDTFTVRLVVTKYTGVRFRVAYTVVNQNGDVLLEGESGHAFIDMNHKPVSLARTIPHRHELMKKLMNP
jgi:acyl-CoA thioester hydrolase